MERIKKFYKGLSKKRKIIFWVSIGLFFISIIRISVWYATKGASTRPSFYIKNLSSQNPVERKFAIYEVGRRQLKQTLPALEKILKEDISPDIKRAAAWSIGRIDREKLVSLLDSTEKETKDIVMEALLKLDKNNINIFLERFSIEDTDIKFKILAIAEKSKEKTVYNEILRIGKNKDEPVPVRKQALQIAAKNLPFSEIESTFWDIYYNDTEKEMKEFAYTLIKGLKEKKQ